MSSDSPSTILTIDLKHQAAITQQLVEQLREEVVRQAAGTFPRLVQGVNALVTNMNRLMRQISLVEDDHKNLLALVDVSQLVNSTLELDEVLRTVMDTIIRLTGAERGFLMLKEPGGKLETRIARNWEMESIESHEQMISQTIVDRVFNDGMAVVTTNAQEDPRFGHYESIIAYNLRSILCVPMKFKDQITGVIYTDNRIRAGIFSDAQKNLLTAFANQAAVAIENARLYESVKRTLNEVTELKNLMDNIFASIASGVITADIEDKILLCNRATEKILGLKRTEMLHQRLVEALPSLAEDLEPQIEQVLQHDQQILGIELSPTLPDRGKVTLSLNLSPLKDADQNTQGVAIVVDDLTEKKRLEAQRAMFERMVSPKVIEMLDPEKMQLGGRRTEITTLFADVRSFTSFSERYDPEELVKILNQYMSEAGRAILEEDGTIDKFMGDAVMAWFNAPILQSDHSLRAVRAALAIVKSVENLHASLPQEFHLNFGVGIHYGVAVLGMVGTEKKMEYTAIGDSVNTAKRIQEFAKGGQILISEDVYRLVEDKVKVGDPKGVEVKGKTQPVTVYEVLGLY